VGHQVKKKSENKLIDKAKWGIYNDKMCTDTEYDGARALAMDWRLKLWQKTKR
jgi:hypothetical protein